MQLWRAGLVMPARTVVWLGGDVAKGKAMRVTVEIPVVAFSDADLTNQSLDLTMSCGGSDGRGRVEITLSSGDTVKVMRTELRAAVEALDRATGDPEQMHRHGSVK